MKVFLKKLYLKLATGGGIFQFVRYLFSGGTATVVDISTLFILYNILHVNHLASAPLAFAMGMTTNYTLNTLFVFKSKGKKRREIPLFILTSLVGLFLTEVILWVFVDQAGFEVMAAKLIAVVVVLFWNFFMRKKFVFSNPVPVLDREP